MQNFVYQIRFACQEAIVIMGLNFSEDIHLGIEGLGSITDLVYARLYHAIIFGKFRPGQRLAENLLVKEMGVSRTPIREALRKLEQDQLVVVKPRHGFMVRKLDMQEAAGIYQVRACLEGLAARLAAKEAIPELVQSLQRIVQESETALKNSHIGALVLANISFHETLVRGTNNATLSRLVHLLHGSVNLLRIYGWSLTSERPHRTVEEHRAICEAIAKGKPTEAEQQSVQHVEQAWEVAKRFFEKKEDEAVYRSQFQPAEEPGMHPPSARSGESFLKT